MKNLLSKVNRENTIKLTLVLLLIVLAVTFRLLPHPPNFVPIGAIAIFGGAILPKKWALSLPLIAMVLSDLLIGFHSLAWCTWGSFVLIALISSIMLKKVQPLRIIGTSLVSSVVFFVVTNFGVWLEGRLYAPTLDGFFSCYYNALPFFRNTLLGDMVFSVTLFGVYYLLYRYAFKRSGDLRVVASHSNI